MLDGSFLGTAATVFALVIVAVIASFAGARFILAVAQPSGSRSDPEEPES